MTGFLCVWFFFLLFLLLSAHRALYPSSNIRLAHGARNGSGGSCDSSLEYRTQLPGVINCHEPVQKSPNK